MKKRQIIAATRIHAGPRGLPPEQRVREWIDCATACADEAIIAFDAPARQRLGGVLHARAKVRAITVSPWNGYSSALNALVAEASVTADAILMWSLEVRATRGAVVEMSHLMDSKTLVVGARMHPGHGAAPGRQALGGETSPWNTFALWNLSRLSMVGFQLISDNLGGSPIGGVEEVPTIALHQMLFPDASDAWLIKLPSVDWMNGRAESAAPWFREKLASKNIRARRHLAALGINGGWVRVQ
ncbi:hypothetical protein [Methylocapsa acidiphila]|uniref:hypothetical protein n=1 Tax=Methylocapsa acidiphila TaxID=133552 RepID=UPI00047C3C08|nr:hypothetical protein [Methylocapsa acidiphila]